MTAKSAKTKKRRRQTGRGALIMIAALLLSSALLRVGDNAGQALALAPNEIEQSKLMAAPVASSCETPEDMRAMLEEFQKREARIAEKEEAIRNRVQALKIADQEIEKRLSSLQDAEQRLRETISLADTAAEGDLDRLTKVYETMKPKQAAALFEEMSPQFAAGFLGRMRPDAAAAIMAGLSPESAHTFSVVLAGRNAEVPRE